ncbi:MAG TPA: hypothetical protein VE650_12135 [Acetobacteraceae bacterium]|nr:hypothetical protein [Acetobacteraceae bacterium]
MKTIFALATVLSIGAALPAISDYGVARSTYSKHAAVLAEGESNGRTPGGRDTALFAEGESNGRTPGGRDTALFAEGEGNGRTPGGRDTAMA